MISDVKTLLYLLPAFPPQGGTYALRMTKHIKYLAKSDVRSTVLVPFESTGQRDESLLNDVPEDCEIHRMGQSGSYAGLGLVLKKAWELTRRETFDYLVTSSPDDRFIYLGYLLSSLLGLEWHCDLREPPRGGGTIRGWLKNGFLGRANLITSPWPSRYIFPEDGDERVEVELISHGFDPDDFVVEAQPNDNEESPTEFLHAGSLFEDRRNPIHFFDVIENLIRSGKIREEEIRFRCLGGIRTKTFEKKLKRTVNERGLKRVISFEPFRNHARVTRQMIEADVCVGFQSTDLLALKIFEYLGSRNPILAYYGSSSPMKNLLQDETGIHWIDYGQKDQLRETILRLHDRNNTRGPEQDLRDRYNLKKSIVPKLKKLYE